MSLPRNVFAPQRADPVGRSRPGLQTLSEPGLQFRRQLGPRPRLLSGDQSRQSLAPVARDPFIHEAWRTTNALGDLITFPVAHGQQYCPEAIALQSSAFPIHQFVEPLKVACVAFRHQNSWPP